MRSLNIAAFAALLCISSGGTANAEVSARIFMHPNGCVYTSAGAVWYHVINGHTYFPGARQIGCPVHTSPVPGAPSQG